MQHRYTGDIGDFGKLALLRALMPGRRLGVAWYLCDGKGETNNDGQHVRYLKQPERFRHLDAPVFDALARLIAARRRHVRHLEALGMLPGTRYFGEQVPAEAGERERWFARMRRHLDRCDLICTDPDNGFEAGTVHPKCITWEEVGALRRRGRALLLYHHQTRRKGGSRAEFAYLSRRLGELGVKRVNAIRLRPFSSRFYFLVDHDDALEARLRKFAATWGDERTELF